MITIDKRKAKSLLNQVVKDKGRDHTSGVCVYFEGVSRPGCIVGHVINLAGYDGEGIVSRHSLNLESNISNRALLYHLDRNGVHVTPAAIQVLSAAQTVQDSGGVGNGTWGAALDAALEV